MKILTKCLLISVLVLLVRCDTRAQEKPGNPDYEGLPESGAELPLWEDR
jgi:hypothetical protein